MKTPTTIIDLISNINNVGKEEGSVHLVKNYLEELAKIFSKGSEDPLPLKDLMSKNFPEKSYREDEDLIWLYFICEGTITSLRDEICRRKVYLEKTRKFHLNVLMEGIPALKISTIESETGDFI